MSVEELKALAEELSAKANGYVGVVRKTHISEVGRKGKKTDEIVSKAVVIEVTQTVDGITMTSGKNRFQNGAFVSPDLVLRKIHELLDDALDGGLRGGEVPEASKAA